VRWKAPGWLAGLALLGLVVWGAWRMSAGEPRAARRVLQEMAALMWKPGLIYDGRTLEARYEIVLQEVCSRTAQSPEQCRRAIERFSRMGVRTQEDAWLIPLAGRRFEAAMAALREIGTGGDWRALTFAGALEFGRGRGQAAEAMFLRAYEFAQQQHELDHVDAASLHTALGALNLSRGQAAAAEPFLRRAKTILDATPNTTPRDHLHVLTHLAQAIFAQGFPEEAEPLCAQALTLAEAHERQTGEPFPQRAVLEANLRQLRAR
jgi:hypothetical protein